MNEAKRLYRSRKDRWIGGVAGGIAIHLGIDPIIIRLIFASTALLGGMGILIYLCLWILIRAEPEECVESNIRRLYRSRKERWLGGVAGGLALYLEVDPIIIRLIFIISTLFVGTSILVYLIMWIMVRSEPYVRENLTVF